LKDRSDWIADIAWKADSFCGIRFPGFQHKIFSIDVPAGDYSNFLNFTGETS
jgi:hypothetical protein